MPPLDRLEAGVSLHRVDSNWTIHYAVLSPEPLGGGPLPNGDIVGRHWLKWGDRKHGWLTSDEFLISRDEVMLQLAVGSDRLFYMLPRPVVHRPLLAILSESDAEEILFPPDASVFTEAIWLFQAQDTQDQRYWNCWAWYQGIVAQLASSPSARALLTEATHPNLMTAVKARMVFG